MNHSSLNYVLVFGWPWLKLCVGDGSDDDFSARICSFSLKQNIGICEVSVIQRWKVVEPELDYTDTDSGIINNFIINLCTYLLILVS